MRKSIDTSNSEMLCGVLLKVLYIRELIFLYMIEKEKQVLTKSILC